MKKQLIEIGARLAERGLIAGSDGNISVRLDQNLVLITPSGLPKGRLTETDLVVTDLDGRQIEGDLPPSSESPMHLFVYRRRPEITACIHSHAPYATACAVSGVGLPGDILPEVVVFVGDIPLTDYAATGTEAVPEALAPFIEDHNAFLLRNHGLLTIGRTLEEAYNRHETVEHYARIIHLARQQGGLTSLPTEEIKRLKKMRKNREKVTPNQAKDRK
ncbi:MAG: class II aldolase/adducin family protein [Candidatus Zixiibacteriota bacterium]